MKIVTTREKYDATARGEPFFTKRKGRKVVRDEPVEIRNEKTGELQTRSKWEYRAGCPVSVGNIVTLRFRDGGKARGRLAVMVVAVQQLEDGRWLIRMERAGTKHRPIPADDRNLYLAPTAGYTSNASRALDPEAATMDTEDARRVMRDTQIKQAPPKPAVKLPPSPVEELTDEERAERIANLEEELAA